MNGSGGGQSKMGKLTHLGVVKADALDGALGQGIKAFHGITLIHSPVMKVTALAGGVGGAKLLVGLDRAGADLTAIVNTGDDAVIYGVHVSPDVDIVTYWLAGVADFDRGWGLKDDTFQATEALGKLGVDAWFNLGDKDLATCLLRTEKLRAGQPLSSITDEFRRSLGVRATVLPMTDDAVRTKIVTTDGRTLEFQEYFVKERQEPTVREVRFSGIVDAKPAPGVLEAIRGADRIILCPSNPVVSIGPILALREVREALREHPSVTAVSPIIAGAPVKGPADKLLKGTGTEVSAAGVAALYRDFVDLFVVDERDVDQLDRLEGLEIKAVAVETLMTDGVESERLARLLLL